MDTAPPRLDPQLVTIQSTSIRYQEAMGDCSTTSYQGVAHIIDEVGGWDLDGMRWHQILTDGHAKDGEEMRERKSAMVRAEKQGYCTISWVAMHHLTTSLGLTHSMGEQLFGTYPGLTLLWKYSEAGRTSVPQQSNWLLLSAVPPDDMERWLVTLIEQGGG
eukprot:1078029-Rhodomonas_salina.1